MNLDDQSKRNLTWGISWAIVLLGFGGCCALATMNQDGEPLLKITTER